MTFLAIIIAFAGLLWAAILVRAGGLTVACLATLLAGSCWGHAFFHASVGPLPLTSERLLLAGVVVLYVVFRRMGWTDPKRVSIDMVVMWTFVGIAGLVTLSHDWKADGAQPLFRLVNFYLMPAVLFHVARQSRIGERQVLLNFAVLGCFGAYLAATAWAESRGWWGVVFPKYIASPAFDEFFGRGRGPFLNPVADGIFMSACLAGGLMFWPRLSRVWQLGIAAFAGLLLIGIYCTLTRSVWLGGITALLIVVGCSLPRGWRLAVPACVLMAGLVIVAARWENVTAFKRDKFVSVHDMSRSASLRPILATVAWHMFLDRPVLGCGLGQYSKESVYYLADRSTGLPLETVRPYVQHNVVLSLLTEAGIVGAGLLVLLLALWTKNAWTLWRSDSPLAFRQHGLLMLGLLAAYMINGMFHDVSIITMVHMLVFYLAGVTSGLCGDRVAGDRVAAAPERLALANQ